MKLTIAFSPLKNIFFVELYKCTYFIISSIEIQKTPSTDPCGYKRFLNSSVHLSELSDHAPRHEYLPHGLRNRINLIINDH